MISSRLTELGLTLPPVAAPIASYTPATRYGGLVYTAGQLPFIDGELSVTGLVGEPTGAVSPAEAADCARTAALNAIAAAAHATGGVDQIAGVLRVTGFVASAAGFTGQPAVINGASDLLSEVFGDTGIHSRSAVGVAALPANSPVEVEVIFIERSHTM